MSSSWSLGITVPFGYRILHKKACFCTSLSIPESLRNNCRFYSCHSWLIYSLGGVLGNFCLNSALIIRFCMYNFSDITFKYSSLILSSRFCMPSISDITFKYSSLILSSRFFCRVQELSSIQDHNDPRWHRHLIYSFSSSGGSRLN